MTATLHALRPAIEPTRIDPYATLTPEVRQAHASLKGLVGRLDRSFGESFCTASQAAEIGRLTREISLEAIRLGRLAR